MVVRDRGNKQPIGAVCERSYWPLTKRPVLATKVTRLEGIKRIIAKMINTSTGATPYSLIYGIEAVLPWGSLSSQSWRRWSGQNGDASSEVS